MPELKIFLDGDGCWPDLPQLAQTDRLIMCMGNQANPIQIAAIPGGMVSGKTSVSLRIDLPDGHTVLTETSLALLKTAVEAFVALHEPESAVMTHIAEGANRLQKLAEEAKKPIVLAHHSDQLTSDGFIYTGVSDELRPGIDGLTIALRCDSDEAQDLMDLIKGYWEKKDRKKHKPRGFGK
jgi:hypothetical protein